MTTNENQPKTRNKSEHIPEKSLMCVLEALLISNGSLERREFLDIVPISGPAATKLLARYRKLIPENSLPLHDKGHSKQYIPTENWNPIFLTGVDAKTFLRAAKTYLPSGFKANPRHALIESLVELNGSVKRADLLDALGLKRAMASNVLVEYVKLNEGALEQDGAHGYKKTQNWKQIALPAFRTTPKKYLQAAEIFLDYNFD